MTPDDVVAHVFRRLKQDAHLDAVLLVIRDARTRYRLDLDGVLASHLLTTEEHRATVYALQGHMKACDEILATMIALADPGPTRGVAGTLQEHLDQLTRERDAF